MNDQRQCDGCGKPAGSIKVYQTKGTEYSELWLCAQCAERLGVEEEFPAFAPTVSELLGSVVSGSGTRQCPSCGTRFRTIRQTGRAGCAECYRVFRSQIQDLLVQSGHTESHVGRYPARIGSYKRLLLDRESIREELDRAVRAEEYETAAGIRDRMKALEEERNEDL